MTATYSHAASGVEFLRSEMLPTLALSKEESPDARLPPGGWNARWQGVLEVLRPGKYRFAADASGDVELSIDGQPVPLKDGEALELSLGLHPIVVRYTAPGEGGARLKLFWESNQFEREQLPAQALGHAKDAPPIADLFALGRLELEEHNCAACHLASDQTPLAKQLTARPGPKLTKAGSRLRAAWIFNWLADPTAQRPEALMPQMFTDDPRGAVERYAVATFLAAQGTPPEAIPDPPAPVVQQTVADGDLFFHRVGCAVCHEAQAGRPARATLRNLGQKTTPEVIETFLKNPSAVAPAGRMPAFVLGKLELRQLALYLTRRETLPPLELPAAPTSTEMAEAFAALDVSPAAREKFAAQPPEKQLHALGREVIRARRCLACHELNAAGEDKLGDPQPSQFDFAAIAKRPTAGCLADVDAASASESAPKSNSFTPRYAAALDRKAIGEFLRQAVRAPAPPAPGETARTTLERFNCLGCHQRDGAGGLPQELINQLSKGDDAAAELAVPPSLTQVTAKLSHAALRGVLEEHQRSRPWMALQMPRFDKAFVHPLPSQLAVLDAEPLAEGPTGPPADAALAETGRTLIGSRGFGCIKCHDILGVPSSGTRGPDLAKVVGRVNYDWYLRWMKDPQRIQPGTRMPTVFLNGESPYKEILGGDPGRQRDAIWQYLATASSLPPPEGLEEAKLQTLAAENHPLVVRTFLTGTTPRGIAVRFPNQVHAAFDAQMGRLAFAWSGEFLDMGPVWNARGGKPAQVLGNIFWTSPPGCPWEVTPADASPPSFSGRNDEPSLGALVKDSRLHVSRLTFNGYKLADAGPTFRYRLALEGEQVAAIAESISALRSDAGVGVLRDLSIAAPADRAAWLHVVDAEEEPRWIVGNDDAAIGNEPRAADPRGVLRIVADGQPMLLHVRDASTAAQWVAQHEGDRWHVLLKVATGREAGETKWKLALWRPADAAAETWTKLVAEELK